MKTTESPNQCPKCGTAIPAEAPRGLCPKCLLAGVATPTEAGQGSRRPAPSSLESVAAAFPAFEVIELIGQGGMGAVYKVRQPKLNRLVALKILPPSLAEDSAFAERFAREGELLARLNHPNIVTVHDIGRANGFFYLLMEYVDGVNLRQAMRAGRFTPTQALALVPKICEALQFAHEEGVLHRDIKPENILLDTKGRIKIADFGIAKLAGDSASRVDLTVSGAALGTPHYMAPEQLDHPGDVDHRADIYSLGVVFYELLTGELPLGRFGPPSEKSPADPRVDEVVLRALERERDRRQQSVAEIKTQVETIATSAKTSSVKGSLPSPEPDRKAPAPPPPPPPPAPPSRPSGENPWPRRLFWLIVALVVVPVMVIGMMLLLPLLARQSSQTRAPANVRLEVTRITVQSNLVVIDVTAAADRPGSDIRATLEGTLSGRPGAFTVFHPEPEDLPVILPERRDRLEASGVRWELPGNRRSRTWTFAFGLPDPDTAEAAASAARDSMDDYARTQLHVRREVVFFDLKHEGEDRTAFRGSLWFSRPHWVEVIPPKAISVGSASASEALDAGNPAP